jgi:hypothetical protein
MQKCALVASGVATAAGATIAATMFGSGIEVYGLSLALIGSLGLASAALSRQVRESARDAIAAYDLGQQLGYDKGYMEGRRVARPVVVPHPSLRQCEHDLEGGDHVRQETSVRQVAGDGPAARWQATHAHRAAQR